MMLRLNYILLLVAAFVNSSFSLRATVFGASGGVGQLICKKLLSEGYSIEAVTRDIEGSKNFELLNGCEFVQADARVPSTLKNIGEGSDAVIINVGTTAFPTKKWQNGNTPRVACVDTVVNICDALSQLEKPPKKVVLLSSIGVERTDKPPFSILNSFGVLEAKLESENILIEKMKPLNTTCIIVRPGRLVGAPFTNFDLAKLFKVEQKEDKCGICIDTREIVNGDIDRADVAETISRLLPLSFPSPVIRFSLVNIPGNMKPTEFEWGKLLSLFTVPQNDLLTTRISS